jgi:hypothetical protein
MNIKRFINVKTLLFILLIALIFILLLVTIITRFTRPSKPGIEPTFGELPAPPLQEGTVDIQPSEQTSSFAEILLPQTAVVYKQKSHSQTIDQALDLAISLGFPNPTIQNSVVYSEEGKKFVLINAATGTLSLKQPLPEYLKSLDQAAIENHAQLLIKQVLGENQIWQNPIINTAYFQMGSAYDVKPATLETADSASVNLFPTIDNKRVIGKGLYPLGERGIVYVKFSLPDELLSLSVSSLGINFSKTGTYPLKSIEQVNQEIHNKKTLVTTIYPEGGTQYDYEYGEVLIPTTAKFTDIEQVYFYDPSPDAILQPVYLFTGKTNLQDGRPAIIKAVLPAINPQLLEQP